MEKSNSFTLGENNLNEIINQIIKLISSGNIVILLEGDLGAGKTRLTQEIIKTYDSSAVVQSPTFVIERIYEIKHKKTVNYIHHLDLYRLRYYSEFIDLGFKDLIYQKGHIFIIEWPKLIEDKLKNYIKIKIENVNNGHERKYTIIKK